MFYEEQVGEPLTSDCCIHIFGALSKQTFFTNRYALALALQLIAS
jgi:hypothetical protein